jgi:hypothetical protein
MLIGFAIMSFCYGTKLTGAGKSLPPIAVPKFFQI